MALCACMLLGVMGNMTVAFAGKWVEVPEGKRVRYVSLGDSMTSGLGLPGYENGGYLETVSDAYPAQVTEHYGWRLKQLATSGMRSEDLDFILRYQKSDPYPTDAWMERELLSTGRWEDLADVAETFQEAVAEADVITTAVGNTNFGTYMLYMIQQLMSEKDENIDLSYATLENGLAGTDPELAATIRDIHAALTNALVNMMPEELVRKVSDVMGYVVASYARHYRQALERIVELNPDVEIVIVGLINNMSNNGGTVVYQGKDYYVNLADIWDLVINPINLYLAAHPTMAQSEGKYPEATFYYAEVDHIEMPDNSYLDVFKNAETVMRERFIRDITEMAFPLMKSELVDITLADVQEYEAALEAGISGWADYAVENEEKAKAVAVYLGMEQAILGSLEQELVINLDEIRPEEGAEIRDILGRLLDGITRDVEDALEEKASEKGDEIAAVLPDADADTLERITSVYVTAEAMESALSANEKRVALLGLYGRVKLIDGMNAYPGAEEHDDLTDAIISAYTGDYGAGDAMKDKLMALIQKLFNSKNQLLASPLAANAVHGTVYLDEDPYYAAIVDQNSMANSASYADKVASELNFAYDKITAEDEEAIEQADLITVGLTQNEVTSFMVQQIKAYSTASFGGTYTPCDWTQLVGQQGAATIEEIKTEMMAMVNNMNLGNMSGYANVAIDAYAYAYVEQLISSIKLVKQLKALNPEALIVLVGQYNPMEGAVLTADASVLPMGDYIQYLVDLVNMELLAFAMAQDNIVYVDAPDVETVKESRGETLNLPVVTFIMNLLMNPNKLIGDMYPSQNGHDYVKEQILNAVTVGEESVIDFTIEAMGDNNTAVYTVSDDFQTLNVVNEEYACVVAYTDSARQSYTRLTAVANGDGYDYDLSAVPNDAIIVIAVKGDINGDGVLSGIEVTRIKAEQLGKTAAFTALQKLVADVNGDGELKGIEVTQIKAAQLGKTMLAW